MFFLTFIYIFKHHFLFIAPSLLLIFKWYSFQVGLLDGIVSLASLIINMVSV